MSNDDFKFIRKAFIEATTLVGAGSNLSPVWNCDKLGGVDLHNFKVIIKSGSSYIYDETYEAFTLTSPTILYNQKLTLIELSDLVDYLNTFNRVSKKHLQVYPYPKPPDVNTVAEGYIGGVYSPTQNRIYFTPYSQSSEAEWHYFDCNTKQFVEYSSGIVALQYGYCGGVYSPTQNRIYLVPYAQSDQALWHYIDCNGGAQPVVSYSNNLEGGDIPSAQGYCGGVYSPTQNRIYLVPYAQSDQVVWHYIDCDTGDVVAYSNNLLGGNVCVTQGYFGGVYSPTQNRIYLVPYSQSDQTKWHYINCDTGNIVSYSHGLTGGNAPIQYAYRGGVYSPTQNRIYFVPYAQSDQAVWHYIDCETGEVVAYSNNLIGGNIPVTEGYTGGVYSPTQNRIYLTPYSQSEQDIWHYIDCATGNIISYSHNSIATPSQYAFAGGVYSPVENKIYFVKYDQSGTYLFYYIDELSNFPVDRGLMASECYNKL